MSLAKESATNYPAKRYELSQATEKYPGMYHSDAVRALRRGVKSNVGGHLATRESLAKMFDEGTAGRNFKDKTSPARVKLLKLDIRSNKKYKLNPSWAGKNKSAEVDKEAGSLVGKMLRTHQALTGDTSRETANRLAGQLKGRSKADLKSGLKNLQGFKGLPEAKRDLKSRIALDTASDRLAARSSGLLGHRAKWRGREQHYTPEARAKLESSNQKLLKATIKSDKVFSDARASAAARAAQSEKVFGKPAVTRRLVGSGQ